MFLSVNIVSYFFFKKIKIDRYLFYKLLNVNFVRYFYQLKKGKRYLFCSIQYFDSYDLIQFLLSHRLLPSLTGFDQFSPSQLHGRSEGMLEPVYPPVPGPTGRFEPSFKTMHTMLYDILD